MKDLTHQADKSDKMFHFIPARLSRGKTWYIFFTVTNPDTLQRIRHRKTYNLNRIPNIKTREQLAQKYIDRINAQLMAGIHTEAENVNSPTYSLTSALQLAMNRKRLTTRPKTMKQYDSLFAQFEKWATDRHIMTAPVHQFSAHQARQFFDHLLSTRRLTGKTMNNYLITMKALFYELTRSDIIHENPFTQIPKFRESQKIRRALSPSEKQILATTIHQQNEGLFLAVVLIYHCFIRPAELRRMQCGMIRATEGVIFLPGHVTKNGDDAIITIPNIIQGFIQALDLSSFAKSAFLFGPQLKPHPSRQCGSNTLNYHHSKILGDLHRTGQIPDITGLSLYSWKDTGDQDLAASGANILDIRDHNRHKSLETTNKYMMTRRRRIASIAQADFTILPPNNSDEKTKKPGGDS